MVARGRNAMVTVAMAFMDLLSFFKRWLSCWVTTLKDWSALFQR